MPYIYPEHTSANIGGYVYHFFDYPGDTSNGGDDDFSFTFQACLSDELRQAAQKKGNLYVNLVAEVLDTSGDHAHAEIGYYTATDPGYPNSGGYRNYTQLKYLSHTDAGKWKQWNSGWQMIPQNAIALGVSFYSTEGGGADANDAEVMMPRVLIKDISQPTVVKVEIQTTGLEKSINNIYDEKGISSRFRAKVGDDIKYIVTFDEPVRFTTDDENSKPKLQIVSSDKSKTLYATLVESEMKNVYKTQYTFHYTLKEGDKIDQSGRVERLVNAQFFEDVGKNTFTSNVVEISANDYKNERPDGIKGNVICDSESPNIHIDGQTYNKTVFYARKMEANDWSKSDPDSEYKILYVRSMEGMNTVPAELKAVDDPNKPKESKYVQNKFFSLNGNDKAVFRIALSDMIDNKLLKLANETETLKLKLSIYDSRGNVIKGRNAYADLIAYRYIGQDDKECQQGSFWQGTNQGWTEMFFAYTPKASDFQGLDPDVYSVDIAALVSGGNFVFDSDLFNKELKDFAGNKVTMLTFPVAKVSGTAKTPEENVVRIDLAAPVLLENESILPDPAASPVAELSGIKLVFEEKSPAGAIPTVKVRIQVVKQSGETGELKPVTTRFAGQITGDEDSLNSDGTKAAVAYARNMGGREGMYELNINSLTIEDPQASITDKYYLEYTVTDSVGNKVDKCGKWFPVESGYTASFTVKGKRRKMVHRRKVGNGRNS